MAIRIVERAVFKLSEHRRINTVLDRFGSAVNKVGIHYDTGKFRWKTSLKLSSNPVEIIHALKGLSGCKSESARQIVEHHDLVPLLKLWKVDDPENVIQTAWEHGYSQTALVDLLCRVLRTVSRIVGNTNDNPRRYIRIEEPLKQAIGSLPKLMYNGCSADEIIGFYNDIVNSGRQEAYDAFKALSRTVSLEEFSVGDN